MARQTTLAAASEREFAAILKKLKLSGQQPQVDPLNSLFFIADRGRASISIN